MDLEVFRALRGPAGQGLLAEAEAAYDERAAIALATRLRRDHPADLVAAALTQVALRRRARTKFGADADRMFFTRDGLEQATTAGVAAYRAGRIAAVLGAGGGSPDQAAAARVADLCCGIGGDLLALARAGLAVTGFDRDPLTAEIARANLATLATLDVPPGSPTSSSPGAPARPAHPAPCTPGSRWPTSPRWTARSTPGWWPTRRGARAGAGSSIRPTTHRPGRS